MKLSRTSLYAVQALLELSDVAAANPVSCRQIAVTRQMPERFLLQILRNLVTHGILTSSRGVDGGYALKRPAAEITLLDLIEALEGPISASVPAGKGLPEQVNAELQRVCAEIAALTRLRLDQITVGSLASSKPTSPRAAEAPRPAMAPLPVTEAESFFPNPHSGESLPHNQA